MVFEDDLGNFLPDVKSDISPEERADLVGNAVNTGDENGSFSVIPRMVLAKVFLSDPKSDYLKGTNGSNNLD